jgi:hypothetical protein
MSEIDIEDYIIKKPCLLCGELTHRSAVVLGGNRVDEFWVCMKHELASTIVWKDEPQ